MFPSSCFYNPKVTTTLNSITSYKFSVFELNINGLLQYVFFCIWLFSFKIGVRFIYIFIYSSVFTPWYWFWVILKIIFIAINSKTWASKLPTFFHCLWDFFWNTLSPSFSLSALAIYHFLTTALKVISSRKSPLISSSSEFIYLFFVLCLFHLQHIF